MDLNLTNKRVLVLGSSSGLGYAIAQQLVQEGAHVAISGRDTKRAQSAVTNSGAKVAVTGDMTKAGVGARLVEEAAQALQGLDIVIINTGSVTPGGLVETSPQVRDDAYDTILRPSLDVAMAAASHLKKSKAGRMIFITARSMVQASPELALSSVFRSGVAAAARSLALELAPDVLVNVVIPGQYDTPAYGRFVQWVAKHDNKDEQDIRAKDAKAIPLGRLGRASELADVVTFLCSPRASFVNGSVIRVDGGAVTGFH